MLALAHRHIFASILFGPLLAGLALGGCDGPAATTDSGPAPADAAVADAAPADAAAFDAGQLDSGAPGDAASAVSCEGLARPDFTSEIQLARGVVIARDGTMYFTGAGEIARRLPDGTFEDHWAPIAGASLLTGLALDAANETIFVGAPDGGGTGAPSVYRVDIATRAATVLVSGGFPYGLTMGPDEMLYYGDTALNAVLRVAPAGGASVMVTTTDLASARGVAFEAGGTLLVASATPGQIFRLTLSASGTETARETVGGPLPTPTGIALDALGRIYVTSEFGGQLLRMNADGTGSETLRSALSSPFHVDFGHGALCPSDLFIVVGGQMTRFANDTAGASVPWH